MRLCENSVFSDHSYFDCPPQRTPYQGEKWCSFKRSANELGAICHFKCNKGRCVYEQVFWFSVQSFLGYVQPCSYAYKRQPNINLLHFQVMQVYILCRLFDMYQNISCRIIRSCSEHQNNFIAPLVPKSLRKSLLYRFFSYNR